MTLTTIDSDYLTSIVYSLQDIAEELSSLPEQNEGYPVGTIVKAKPNQERFKDTSMWVSLGNGNYKHLTGSKGLIAKHDRLDGFVDVVFQP
jgi:hypothetical protein